MKFEIYHPHILRFEGTSGEFKLWKEFVEKDSKVSALELALEQAQARVEDLQSQTEVFLNDAAELRDENIKLMNQVETAQKDLHKICVPSDEPSGPSEV